MSKIKKAVIPVAGLGTRFLPITKSLPKEMLPLIDKPIIQYVVEEAYAAGIEEFVFVTARGKNLIEDYFDISYELEKTLKERQKTEDIEKFDLIKKLEGKIYYVRQQNPLGLGHAIYCAKSFIKDEPFAILLPDEILFSNKPCMSELVQIYNDIGSGNLISVMPIAKDQVNNYGIIEIEKQIKDLIYIKGVVEKPNVLEAPSNLAIIGRYILQPEIFKHLENKKHGVGGEIQLTDALVPMLRNSKFYGVPFKGERFDCGKRLDLLLANLKIALSSNSLSPILINKIKKYLKGK